MDDLDVDDLELDMDGVSRDEQAARRSRRRFRMLLDIGSIALFAIFLVHLIPVLFQCNPLSPAWQAEFVDVLVNQGVIAFLGFVLLHLAHFIQPTHERLRRRLRLVRRLAVLAVAGYLLLVPLQLFSTISGFETVKAKKANFLEQGARLSEVRAALQNAQTVSDLNVRLQSLLQPALTSDQLAQPLPVLRKVLLADNDIQQQKLSTLLIKGSDEGTFFEAINRIGSALGWALAFAGGAVPWGSHSTLVERLRRRRRPK